MKTIFLAVIAFCSISLHAQNGSGNEEVNSIEIGNRFRELVASDSNNAEVKLSDYCGKGYYTLLEFGVTWCRPCHKDVPILKGIHDKYHPYGLKMISVFIDAKRASWENFVKKYEINWLHVLDTNGNNAKALYGVKKIPFYLIINPEGLIVYKRIGGLYADNTLVPKLQELYGF